MTTTNIVSTPNITGNIGSCTTDKVSITESADFWESMQKDILTNSCTGQVTEGPIYWSGGFTVGAILMIGIFAAFIGLGIMISNL